MSDSWTVSNRVNRAPKAGRVKHTRQRKKPGPRAELTRTIIMETALELIDRNGLPALNMRELGLALGASTMSVYRHFKNKSELLDAIVDEIIANLPSARIEGSWQDHCTAFCTRVRSAMIAHPDLAPLIGLEFRRSPTSLRVNAELIDRLQCSGVPESLVAETYWAVACFTTGYALLEAQKIKRGGNRQSTKDLKKRTKKVTDILTAVDDIPAPLIPGAAKVLACTMDDDQFRFGLDSLIQGIEMKIQAQNDA